MRNFSNLFLAMILMARGTLANDDIACGNFDGRCLPIVDTGGLVVTYVIGEGAVAVDSQVEVFYSALPQLSVAILQFGGDGYYKGEDVLAFQDTTDITSYFNQDTGALFLFGPSSPDEFQAAMRLATYSNIAASPHLGARTIYWTVSNDDGSSGYTPSVLNVVAPGL